MAVDWFALQPVIAGRIKHRHAPASRLSGVARDIVRDCLTSKPIHLRLQFEPS
jgi:hypothetical protein